MPYLSLEFPPGIYRNGTERQARGRWYNANLIRFYEGTIRPIGGWRAKTPNTVTGKGRAIISWKDNSSVTWSAIGTEQKLYCLTRSGYLYDITPSGLVTGFADALTATGYGGGAYGSGPYGWSYQSDSPPVARGYGGGSFGVGVYSYPPPDTAGVQDATVWSLDTWGQYLVGCNADDGNIYQWQLNTSARATVLSNAPTARAVVVSDQRILMALGAGGNPRNVAWSDQENNTLWTAAATNQAGAFNLQTAGKLMCGKRFQGAVLLFTDVDVWLASYTADVYVYSFRKLGAGCGVIAQNAATVTNAFAAWMSASGFWTFNGYVQKVPCEVSDYVSGNLNAAQASKISCWHNSAYQEITWFYPSKASTENDSYVTWNYQENHWTIGALPRLSAVDRGATLYPLLVGADGYVYEHEEGFSYQDVGGAVQAPFLESGPVEFGAMPIVSGAAPVPGNGDMVMYARQLLPDDRTVGDVTVTFKTRFYPDGPETAYGPYTCAASTDVRFSGRSLRLRYDGAMKDDWRVGAPRLDVVSGGRR